MLEKVVVIIRGVSGSGKSRFASMMSDRWTRICCADDFFMQTGKYIFDASRLSDAHKFCREIFDNALDDPDCNRIIIANTNTSPKEFEYYENKAKEYGLAVFHIVIENRHGNGNNHGVPQEVLDRQCERLAASIKLI